MSFAANDKTARTFAPGWFLAAEDCERETYEISATGAQTTAEGGKFVAMGTAYPSNDGNAIGIIYEDIDVSTGNMPGSVVTKGTVYEDRLPVALAGAAKTALEALGFVFKQSPAVTR